ncbi:MAG: aldehyde dehydrogenase family protein [Burkholderiaceae bacterium]
MNAPSSSQAASSASAEARATTVVAGLVESARTAQAEFEKFDQNAVDQVVLAAGWAIMEPDRNRALAELAVSDTGLGDVDDKIAKNHRKTLGLLRDLAGAKSVGVISHDEQTGVTEIARPVGVVAAITPSTNPGATPANKIINALKGRNAVILAPSPKGWTTARLLLDYVHAELERGGMSATMARSLVQVLPQPVTKAATHELMRQADLIVATGSQSNIRAAYSSGTPAFGVGAGNVSVIVDASADVKTAAEAIAKSKTFDHATSCSSENSVVILDAVYDETVAALEAAGGVMLNDAEKEQLQGAMWPAGKLSGAMTAQSATVIAMRAGLDHHAEKAGFLMVAEEGFGPAHPFSGEKLSPVLAVYRAADMQDAMRIVSQIYDYQGAGHSVGLHARDAEALAHDLANQLPVSRVIVNQAHCIATGGSFDNGLPFSLSMGCGTWGGNSFSSNMNYTHYLNITRIARPIAPVEPSVDDVFATYFEQVGRG